MATRQYIGARYVPKFATPTEWNSALSYESLTIVTHLGNSFTSKKPVPAGVDIANTEYWANTGNYNAQVEEYRQQTIALQGLYEKLDKKFSTLPLNVTDFGAVGDNATDCTNAFQSAIDKAIETGKAVYIPTGVYRVNSLTINTNNGIRIIGEQSSNPNKDDHGAVLMYTGSGSLFTLGNSSGAAYNCLFEKFSVRAIQHFDSVFTGMANEDIFTDLTLTFGDNICDYAFKFRSVQVSEIRNIASARAKTFAKVNASMLCWFHHNNVWISDTGFEINWGNFIVENNWMEWVYTAIKIDNNLHTDNTEMVLNAVNNYFLCPNEMSEANSAKFIHVNGPNTSRGLRVNGNAIGNIIEGKGDEKIQYPFYFESMSEFDEGMFNVSGNFCSNVSGGTIYNGTDIAVVDGNNISGTKFFVQGQLPRTSKNHTPVSFTDRNIVGVGEKIYFLARIFLPTYGVEGVIESDGNVEYWVGNYKVLDMIPDGGKIFLRAFVDYDGTNTNVYVDVNGTRSEYTLTVNEPFRNVFTRGSGNFTIKYINYTSK